MNDTQPARYLMMAGTGRSGTTILRTSLGLHPQIYYNGKENNLVQDVLEVAIRNCTLPSRQFAMVVSQEHYDRAFRRLVIELLWPNSELRKRRILMAAINPTGDLLDYTCQAFPRTRILGLVRNGIEVICSRQRYASFSDDDFEQHCATWLRTRSVLDWGRQNPNLFRLIRHEWMYQPAMLQAKLADLFAWLGLEDCPLVANQFEQSLSHPTGDNPSEFDQLSPPDRAAYFQHKSDGWREWSPAQRQIFKQSCADFMAELGYEVPF